MKKNCILLLLLVCSFVIEVSAQMPPAEGGKIVLPLFGLQDKSIEAALKDVNTSILKRDSGFLWPVTKITFTKKADDLFIDVMAIDNSWFRLFESKEDLYGYFVCNNRMFVVTGRGEEPLPLNEFFVVSDDTRTFYKPNLVLAPPSNPIWHYKYNNGEIQLLEAEHLEVLGK